MKKKDDLFEEMVTNPGVLQQHMPSDSLKASCLAASELFLFLFFVILY